MVPMAGAKIGQVGYRGMRNMHDRIKGQHPRRNTIIAMGSIGLFGVGLLGALGFGLQQSSSVTTGKGALKFVALIPPQLCGAEDTAHVSGDKAAWHVDLNVFGLFSTPHLASVSESFSGDIGAKVCTGAQATLAAATYNPTSKKYVININKPGSFDMTVYPINEKWNPDGSLTAAALENISSSIKAIPGLDFHVTDAKHNSLQNIALLEAYRVAAETCGPVALKHLTDPNASKTNLQGIPNANAPKDIQDQIINSEVQILNSVSPTTHVTFTPNDFEVNITPDALKDPTFQFQQEINTINAHKPSGFGGFPNIKKIPACVDNVGKAA